MYIFAEFVFFLLCMTQPPFERRVRDGVHNILHVYCYRKDIKDGNKHPVFDNYQEVMKGYVR